MTNGQIYRRTIGLSFRRMLWDLICILLIFGLPVAAFFMTQNRENVVLYACGGALLVGCILAGVISHFISHLLEAGQLAMMAEGVANGQLPDNVYQGAKEAVKKRFVTVSVFYVIRGLISGITNQITHGVSSLTSSIGGSSDTAKGIAGGINAIISIVLHYVCDCSMAWVFIHPDENAFKLVCDGAVVYFQNWKALLKNVGKVLLISIISLAIVCAPLTVGAHSLMDGRPGMDEMLNQAAVEINQALADSAKEGEEPFQVDAATLLWIVSAMIALAIWAVVHGTLVEPYVQISVLSTYIRAAQANPPRLDVYGKLCGISKKFKKAADKAQQPVTA